PALQFRYALQLSFVLGSIEMAIRFRNQARVVNLPQFAAADPNVISRSRMRASQCPVKCGSVSAQLDLVECDPHVRKIAHESARTFRNGSSSGRWRAVVHAERAILGEERGYAFRIVTAPSFGIPLREIDWITHITARIAFRAISNHPESRLLPQT